MNVRIFGNAPTATVLTGLLAAQRQEVIWNPDAEGENRLKALKRRREIRLNLPWGWVRTEGFQLSSSSLLKAGEVGLAAFRGTLRGKAGGSQRALGGKNQTLVVLEDGVETDGSPGHRLSVVPGTKAISGLSLLEAIEWDPGFVEVSSPQPRLLVQEDAGLGELQRCLKTCRIVLQQVDDLDPYRNSLHIRTLLALPVALCHSTLPHFLSYPEGREIAIGLLEEGLRLYSHRGLPLAKLPDADPQELLQKLKRGRPKEFDKSRNLPDRAYGPGLHKLLRSETEAARHPHRRILNMSSQTGIDPEWNWAITQKLNRAIRVGFYRDPVELYNALR
jgi:hypothetical protein